MTNITLDEKALKWLESIKDKPEHLTTTINTGLLKQFLQTYLANTQQADWYPSVEDIAWAIAKYDNRNKSHPLMGVSIASQHLKYMRVAKEVYKLYQPHQPTKRSK